MDFKGFHNNFKGFLGISMYFKVFQGNSSEFKRSTQVYQVYQVYQGFQGISRNIKGL